MPGCRSGDVLSLPAGEALSKVRGERGPGAGPEGGLQPGREPGLGGGCGGAGMRRRGLPTLSAQGGERWPAADLSSRESCRLWFRVLKMSATLFAW